MRSLLYIGKIGTKKKGVTCFMGPEPDGTSGFPWLNVVLLVILTFINGFFSASEIAIITLNDAKINKMAEDGDRKAAKVLRLTKNSNRFLSTIQICITFSGFLNAAAGAQSFAEPMAAALGRILPVSHSTLSGVSFVVVTILISFVSLVFGELLPKQIGLQRAEPFALRYAGFLNTMATIFTPFVKLLTASTNGAMRLAGLRPGAGDEETVTEEEIRLMVDAGEEKGVIEEQEKDMISNVLDFDDVPVIECMTHRTDIAAVEDTDSVQDVVDLSIEKGFSRIPVYHEDIDNILGFIYVKDLLQYIGKDARNVRLSDLMRPAAFVPETQKCSVLFRHMTEQHRQIAVIVDEYGGTEGLVTLEDLLECIVGNIQDEYDQEEEEILQDGPNRWSVDGTIFLDEVEDLTGVALPEGEYDTLAGFMVDQLGRIPKSGEHPTVAFGPLTLTVLRVRERRIERIMIAKKVPPKPDDDAPGEQKETGKAKAKTGNGENVER